MAEIEYRLQHRLMGERDWTTDEHTTFPDVEAARRYRDNLIQMYPMVDFRLMGRGFYVVNRDERGDLV